MNQRLIRTIIVDDEALSRKSLEILLNKHEKERIEIVGDFNNVEEAFIAINDLKPALVLLDIEMGHQTGFDLIAKFEQPFFKVIFITAYDKYALKAIKFCALDYLLKPIDAIELSQAIAKAKKAIDKSEKDNFKNLITALKYPHQSNNKITIPTTKGFRLMSVGNIQYLEAEKEYTILYCIHGVKLYSTTRLGEYEEILSEMLFFRIHHSYLVNKEHIDEYVKGEGGLVIIKNNIELPVSRRRKSEFLEWLQI